MIKFSVKDIWNLEGWIQPETDDLNEIAGEELSPIPCRQR